MMILSVLYWLMGMHFFIHNPGGAGLREGQCGRPGRFAAGCGAGGRPDRHVPPDRDVQRLSAGPGA